MFPLHGDTEQVAIIDLIIAHRGGRWVVGDACFESGCDQRGELIRKRASLVGFVTAAKGWAKNNGR